VTETAQNLRKNREWSNPPPSVVKRNRLRAISRENLRNSKEIDWRAVWDDFRNWVGLGLEAREKK
jgi:hypothetical protein